MTFEEIKAGVVEECKLKQSNFTEKILASSNMEEMKQVLADNINWCIALDIKLPDGNYQSFYGNGNLDIESTYVNGEKHGVYKEWRFDGQPYVECTYENGEKHGVYKKWFDNGQLYRECIFEKGKLNGVFKEWYDNGQLKLECTDENGILNGVYKQWYYNGQLEIECTYENGEMKTINHISFDSMRGYINASNNKKMHMLLCKYISDNNLEDLEELFDIIENKEFVKTYQRYKNLSLL